MRRSSSFPVLKVDCPYNLFIQMCVKAITCIRGVLLQELRLPWSGRRDSSLASSGQRDRGGSLAAPRETSVGTKFLSVPCLRKQ